MAKETNIIKQFNNGTLIATVPKNKVRDIAFTDMSLLRDTFKETRQHLGMLELFQNLGIANVPLIKELTAKKSYLYTNGIKGSFTWDVPLEAEFPEVVYDVEEGDFLGIAGDTFKIMLSYPFRQNDILTYDPVDGAQIIVVGEQVEDTGDGHLHTVKLVSNDPEAWFPKEKLVAGTRFGKIDSSQGEYDTQFSGIDPSISNSKATLEFRLGDIRGVEVSWSMYAKSVTLATGEKKEQHDGILAQLERTLNAWGASHDDAIVFGHVKGQKLQGKGLKIDGVLEVLAMAELQKMTSLGVMFNQGATITGGVAAKTINEGLYPMMRRGNRYTYNNASELKAEIQKAADRIFAGLPIRTEDRQLKFKAGFQANQLVRDMFKKEFTATMSIFLDQKAVPVNLLSGNDRNNLTYQTYAIGKAYINGVGNVEIEHDPSFDYDFGDHIQRGFVGKGGRSKRTWSLAIWDASDSAYSNAMDSKALPDGVKVESKAMGNNVFLVKPEGMLDINTSYRHGLQQGTNMNQVLDHMGSEFKCFNSLSAWIKDLSRVVLIERPDIDYKL